MCPRVCNDNHQLISEHCLRTWQWMKYFWLWVVFLLNLIVSTHYLCCKVSWDQQRPGSTWSSMISQLYNCWVKPELRTFVGFKTFYQSWQWAEHESLIRSQSKYQCQATRAEGRRLSARFLGFKLRVEIFRSSVQTIFMWLVVRILEVAQSQGE